MAQNNLPPLWPHQEQAIEFARDKEAVMLDMAMRTGKSRVIVELLAQKECKQVLILCPSSVVDVWPEQFHQYARNKCAIKSLRKGSIKRRTSEAQTFCECTPGVKIIVVNYEVFDRDMAHATPFMLWAFGQEWDALVMDESHRLKAPGGVRSRNIHRLSRNIPFRIALTGTPMPHRPLDIYAQYRILDSSIFGTSYQRMKNNYAIEKAMPQGFPLIVGYKNLDDLYEKFRRIAFSVGPEVLNLPEPMHINRYCQLSSKGQRVYRELEREFYAEVEQGVITAANAMVKGLRLQQITSGHVRLADSETMTQVDDSKKKLLREMLEDLNEPVVVFCRFRSDLDAIGETGLSLDWEVMELSGRCNDLERWQQSENARSVLAVQIQAGGVGINLSRAKIAIYYSLGLSNGDHQQSLARMQEKDQGHSLTYYYLLAEGTIDEKVARALKNRQDVIDAILRRDDAKAA